MKQQNKLPNFERLAKEIMQDLPDLVSITALNFFKESFYKQGFTDNTFQKWPDRKTPGTGRAILTNTSNLRESLRILEATMKKVEIGTSEPYAQIHNDGGILNIPVTAKSRKYFWFMYKATGKSMWKALALTKKERLTVKMPKRQFIGESKQLNQQIDDLIIDLILKSFKNVS
jgi:phage gpG-like protein